MTRAAIWRSRRAVTLAAIILVQGLCALFFVSDVVIDTLAGQGLGDTHTLLEIAATVALCAGVVYLMIEMRSLLTQIERMEIGLRAARGETQALVDEFFDQWQLTPAERDVALFILKGLDHEAIARLRGTSDSTVRVQSAKVYEKAGVSGRSQLFSIFMDELLAETPLIERRGD